VVFKTAVAPRDNLLTVLAIPLRNHEFELEPITIIAFRLLFSAMEQAIVNLAIL